MGFGGMLALSIGQNCPGLAESNPGLQKMVYGAFGLPVGLLMVRGFSMLHPTSIAVLAQTDWSGRHVYAVVYEIPQTWSKTQMPAECPHRIACAGLSQTNAWQALRLAVVQHQSPALEVLLLHRAAGPRQAAFSMCWNCNNPGCQQEVPAPQ